MIKKLMYATINRYRNMKKQKSVNQKNLLKTLHLSLAVVLLGSLSFSSLMTALVSADRFQEQINALSAENGQKKDVQSQLGAEAAGIADVIAKLQAEINAVQNRINENQAKVAELKVQIKAAEEELARQRDLLGQTIKAMYLEGDITTVEMLASSKDLSDFFDKQQYRESVRSKIKTTLDKITQLKLDLNTQKETVEKLIAEQQALQAKLDSQRAENHRLLNLNVAEQNALDAQIKNNNGKIAELRKQQAIENAKLFRNGQVINGGSCSPRPDNTYPDRWCNIPQDSVIDSWGMYNRECVSYTAWKVYESGRHMPYWGGVGNANQWDENARRAGIPVDGSPRAGDVAVSNTGYYGHVMYVESVNANGTINISQYNAGLNGTYSQVYNMGTGGLVFIHF